MGGARGDLGEVGGGFAQAASNDPSWRLDFDAALDKLPADAYELFVLLYVQQLEIKAICERLGLDVDAVYARKSRLIKRLRKLLTGED
ncbi:RNA polymerase sigma factor [Nannocystis pusilla]|uniref:RNA polymerase sigma factor n=1 Tax=Nannocystis pusilla TaxID=889268 RepID=UPI003B7A8BBB